MVLAKYQHMSILEFILIIKQHILILCKKKATHVIKLGFALDSYPPGQYVFPIVGKVVSNKCCL
jgi:hypothetical protein